MTKNQINTYVILSFNEFNLEGNQESMKINIPFCPDDIEPRSYFHREFFPRVVKACQKRGRDHTLIYMISTSSDWGKYEDVTKSKGLDHDHPCKWYFGEFRTDMDQWEHDIVEEYGIGRNVKEFWFDSFNKKPSAS